MPSSRLAVFDQFKACDILGHVKEVAPYLEQKLDELVEKYDFLITRRGKGLMQGVVCKLPWKSEVHFSGVSALVFSRILGRRRGK